MKPLTAEFGPSGIVSAASDGFLSLTGLTEADLGARSLFEVVEPRDIPVVLQAMSALTLGVPAAYFEARADDAEGATRHLTWSVQAAGDAFQALLVDVTAQRIADGTATGESRLRMALAVARGGAWDYDVARRRLRLDPTFGVLFGMPPDEPVTRWADVEPFLHPEDRERWLAASPETGVDLEVRTRDDGSGARHLAVRGRLIERDGGPGHVIGVAWDVSDTKALESQLIAFAMNDHLTGIRNRRAFEAAVRDRWRQARRSGDAFAFLMLDIDAFKAFNDTHGHLAGDEQLVKIGRALAAEVGRPGDVVARYGGEEFAVLLADSDLRGAVAVAERMVRTCRELGGPTISAGAAVNLPDDPGPWDALRRADRALYAAKAAGRDRVAAAGATSTA